jgi:nitrite reductase (NO-forming)
MSQTVIHPDPDVAERSAESPEPPEGAPPEVAAAQADRSPGDDRIRGLEDRIDRAAVSRDALTVSVFVFSAIALLAAMVGIGLGWRAVDEAKGGAGATGAAPAAETPLPATVNVNLADFSFRPSEIRVAEGGTLNVTNIGAVPHNLKVDGTTFVSKMLEGGGTDTMELTGLAPGTYEILCDVPGHAAAGMTGTLHVGSVAGKAEAAAAAPAAARATGATIDDASPAPAWRAFDPALQPAPGGTVHDVRFAATETVMEVAPGVKQELWTFNGQVPGPTLRGKVGDVFNVTLVNEGRVGHSIDFHASKVAPNVAMRTIGAGESLVYQFKAEFAGIWMYHCGTPPALHHIGNGMYGAVIIDPPGLPAVDREYVIVQSELYLGPDGKPGDLAKMQAAEPDAVVFNGYVSQYKFAPIKVDVGQRVRVWVLDAGPSENSAFHIVGTVFDTVYKEGQYLLRPDSSRGGAQALDLQPSQGGFVEFTLTEQGQYPMVTHKFANVGKGALGLFQAGAATGPMGH